MRCGMDEVYASLHMEHGVYPRHLHMCTRRIYRHSLFSHMRKVTNRYKYTYIYIYIYTRTCCTAKEHKFRNSTHMRP